MASPTDEIAKELPQLGVRLYKDGRVDRSMGTGFLPPSLDPTTAVNSTDAVINSVTNLSARIYTPNNPNKNKLPLLVHFHGGGFCIESASSPLYNPFCNSLATSANCVIVSVNYRLAPENPIPIPYEDSWEAIKWVVSKRNDPLLEYADFEKIYLAGDSAGANITHHMAIRVRSEGIPGVALAGIVLIHPYFWGKEPVKGEPTDVNMRSIIDKIWLFVCPDSSELGVDDPFINPTIHPGFSDLGCDRVLVCVAEKDGLSMRGWDYYEKLGASEWKGEVEILESKGENHVFHLFNPDSESAKDLVKRVGSFLNHKKS